MKIFNYLLLFFLITMQSCIKSDLDEIRFNEVKELKGAALHTDSVCFRYPFRIRQCDSVLYILDLHGREFYCYQFSYPKLTFKKSLAPIGNGPKDFLSAENIRINKESDVYLLDANRKQISILSGSNKYDKKIKLTEKLIRSLDFDLINDSLFVVTDYTGKCRIDIVNASGNIVKQLFKIPTRNEKNNRVSDIVLAQAWRSFIDYNPNNGILAVATQLGQVVEIYDQKKEKTVSVLYGRFGEPKFINEISYAIPSGIMGYSDVRVGNDKVYAIFWGYSFKEIRKNPSKSIEGGNILQVFNLEGKPICQYILDRYITGFCIDEKNNKLLGLDVNSDRQIVEYEL